MAALTDYDRRDIDIFVDAAKKRNPRGDYIGEGVDTWREWRRMGRVSEAAAVNTNTNRLNDLALDNTMADAGGNSFEQFLSDMIQMIATKAAADGKVNPAYTKLAAQLAAAQAMSSAGVQRSSYVNPAAGSTPVGQTESAPRARVTEALTFAGTALPGQGSPGQPAAAAPAAKPFDQMTPAELQHEHIARLNLLHSEGALKSPFYATTAA
jgi:hypothetical protein